MNRADPDANPQNRIALAFDGSDLTDGVIEGSRGDQSEMRFFG
jgi:hypothetical protein